MIVSDSKWLKIFGEKFEVLETGFNDGQYNMDFDFNRTIELTKNKTIPMFRLYGWQPWTVSLGFNQKEADIDKSLLEKNGFDLVRRPTGGRAVLHANEITYSVVTKLPKNYSPQDIYKDIHILLMEGLKKLNPMGLEFEKSQPDFKEFYNKEPGLSISCFASSARYEIEYQGRKVVGSAQRLFGDVLLQHGSIILDRGHEQLADVSVVKDEDKRNKLRNYILNHSATLSEVCNRKITYHEASTSLLSVFL